MIYLQSAMKGRLMQREGQRVVLGGQVEVLHKMDC
jgi:hypothetical protein